jgi:flagellar motor switch protein FliG
MKVETSGIRKAAILVAALDGPAADRVLDRMAPAQAQQVRRMTMELLDRIDPQEQRQVVDEFLRIRPMVPKKQPAGIELDGRLARRLLLRQTGFSADEAASPDDSKGPPFRFLHDAEGERLAALLAGERPQTIALVLSHLPPKQAGHVLARLAPALQVDVIRRLVDLEETQPEILQEVERALESRFSEEMLMQRRRVAGLVAVAGILEASEAPVGTQILNNLTSHDRPLAERLSPPRLTFADVAGLDDATLAAIFRAAEPPLAILALVGAPEELIERVLAGLPTAEAGMIRDRLLHLGPTRLADVEEARRRVAELAHRLAMEGRIDLPRKPR